MSDFDAMLKRSFAEAHEPVDDGFTVSVTHAVAGSERGDYLRSPWINQSSTSVRNRVSIDQITSFPLVPDESGAPGKRRHHREFSVLVSHHS